MRWSALLALGHRSVWRAGNGTLAGGILGLMAVPAGCGNPISNQLFLEDGVFLSALPSSARLGPPSDVRNARVGTSRVLTAASIAASELDDIDVTLRASGEALRSAQPTARGNTERSWDAVSTAVQFDGRTYVWWVRATVSRPFDDAAMAWTLEAATEAGGEWSIIGDGVHDPEGVGTMDWDLDRQLAVMGIDERVGVLEIAYDEQGFEGETRAVETVLESQFGISRTWVVGAEAVLVWSGFLDGLTIDGQAWPGGTQVAHTAEGGWARGVLWRDGVEIPFASCWDALGDEVFLGGDPAIDAVGTEQDCPIADPFEGSLLF